MEYNTIIIGSGVAGMTAAIYLKRAGVSVCILEKDVPGGQITRASNIDNYPGFISIDGPDLAMNIYNQVNNLDVPYIFSEAIEIEVENDMKIIKTNDQVIKCKNIIIATGRSPRKLQVPNEEELIGKGISYCAICDGSLFKDKSVAVIGGGRAALEESLYLSKMCNNITLIHRNSTFKADDSLVNEVISTNNITILTKKEVDKFIINDNKISGIIYKDENNKLEELKVDGAFIYIGQVPNTTNFSNLDILDDFGYVQVNENFETKIENIYAIGDCVKKDLYQIITACSDGAVVASRITKH